MHKKNSISYRMPAEWELHKATWLTWPHNPTDWPCKMSSVQKTYAGLAQKLAAVEEVCILVNSERHEMRARRYLKKARADLANIHFHHIPTNRSWIRDYGPVFVADNRTKKRLKRIMRFRFNGWARYSAHQKDDSVPLELAHRLSMKMVSAKWEKVPLVLEGGSIDVNGFGTLITTEECLLDRHKQPRNPGITKSALENMFREYLGITNVIWLNKGIEGDDTHGHVDDICRFVDRQTIVLTMETNPSDTNAHVLAENMERLKQIRLENGSKPTVVSLPMPRPIYLKKWRLPASYANFYIANKIVLVPIFNDPADRKALGILAGLFPEREVIGIHAVDLLIGLGGIHCITLQEPV
ncbi:MAG: agmatine deiminase family protein [Candidatus Scalindua sp.]|jgi:agmatine deiminase|nr:agmatine deiminase family protein [Candidatus Scalindua sp.]MDV5165125.1 agmatine deiminase family protein [Candidatus Scalindua sp.]